MHLPLATKVARTSINAFFMNESSAVDLKVAISVQKLVHDKEFVLELLSRYSWLAVLLGAATYAGALAAAGGFDSGLPFVSYSAADCKGMNQTAPYSALMQCNTSGPMQNCSISDADPGGCVKVPDQCTDIHDTHSMSCRVKPDAKQVMDFLLYNVLSFNNSMSLIVLVVTCSMPLRRVWHPAAAAVAIWWFLAVGFALLMTAVFWGSMAVQAALLAVLPKSSPFAFRWTFAFRFVVISLGSLTGLYRLYALCPYRRLLLCTSAVQRWFCQHLQGLSRCVPCWCSG
jgi:hypothetical protein